MPHSEKLGDVNANRTLGLMELQPGLIPSIRRDFQEDVNLVRIRIQYILYDHWLLRIYHAALTGGVALK